MPTLAPSLSCVFRASLSPRLPLWSQTPLLSPKLWPAALIVCFLHPSQNDLLNRSQHSPAPKASNRFPTNLQQTPSVLPWLINPYRMWAACSLDLRSGHFSRPPCSSHTCLCSPNCETALPRDPAVPAVYFWCNFSPQSSRCFLLAIQDSVERHLPREVLPNHLF